VFESIGRRGQTGANSDKGARPCSETDCGRFRGVREPTSAEETQVRERVGGKCRERKIRTCRERKIRTCRERV